MRDNSRRISDLLVDFYIRDDIVVEVQWAVGSNNSPKHSFGGTEEKHMQSCELTSIGRL